MWPFKNKDNGLGGTIDGADWDRRLAIIQEQPLYQIYWSADHLFSPEFSERFIKKKLSECEFQCLLLVIKTRHQRAYTWRDSNEITNFDIDVVEMIDKITTYESIFPLIDRYNSR